MSERKSNIKGKHAAPSGHSRKGQNSRLQKAASSSPQIVANSRLRKAPNVFGSVMFVVVVFALMLIPLVGMAWNKTETTTENRELAAPPVLVKDGAFNIDFLSDCGTYFLDHYAYRNDAVDVSARLHATVFGTSITEQVIVGQDGWLYYGGTLNDFLGRNQLSERGLFNVAHNLSLMQSFCQAKGAEFLFIASPDKNLLYPEHMPTYYIRGQLDGYESLKAQLDKQQVRYLDVVELLGGQKEKLYYQTDSHWNTLGALRVAKKANELLRHPALAEQEARMHVGSAHTGDLSLMLYPMSAKVLDANAYDQCIDGVNDRPGYTGSDWSFKQGSSVEDGFVITQSSGTYSGSASGSLLMFRDSFANNLMGFFACDYQKAVFSKMIPYNALSLDDHHPDAVIVERAQRHVSYLAENAPIMPSPQLAIPHPDEVLQMNTTCEQAQNGPLTSFSGIISADETNEESVRAFQEFSPESRIFVTVRSSGQSCTYEAFCTTDVDSNSDWGYLSYVDTASLGSGQNPRVSVFVLSDGTLYEVQ